MACNSWALAVAVARENAAVALKPCVTSPFEFARPIFTIDQLPHIAFILSDLMLSLAS